MRLCTPALAALVLGCATTGGQNYDNWQYLTGTHGVRFRAPANVKWNPTWRDGGAFVAPGYYLAIDWDSYERPSTPEQRAEWAQGPKHDVEVGDGYRPPWPFAASLHMKWIRPGASTEPPPPAPVATKPSAAKATSKTAKAANTKPPAPRKGTLEYYASLKKQVPGTSAVDAPRDYRILYVTARCKSRRDLETATRILETVQFTPW